MRIELTMSKFEQELRVRLAAGEDPEAVACWYMRVLIKANLPYEALSPFEREFEQRMRSAALRWQRQRSRH
jgi:hypothetical protein